MSRNWQGGSTRRWRRVRAAVLLRDGYLCQLRIPGVCTVQAPERGGHAHHLHGKGQCPGCDADLMDHVVAACRECNLAEGEPIIKSDPPNQGVTKW